MTDQTQLDYLKQKRNARLKKSIDDKVEFIASPNFSSRRASAIDMIVIHYTGATRIGSSIDWFKRPESKVSAHYLIGRDGRLVQMVEDQNKAWHAGYSYWDGSYNVNPNSIGIELVGTADTKFTKYQYETLITLSRALICKHDIPLDRIVGHEHIAGSKAFSALQKKNYSYSDKQDPGKHFDWELYLQSVESSLEKEKQFFETEPIKDVNPEPINIYEPQINMNSGQTSEDRGFWVFILDLLALCVKWTNQ